jgi:GNAT superfamily N-acetyltransferase
VSDLSAVEPLSAAHRTDRFDCGKRELNEYLKQYALVNQAAGGARTFVVHRNEQVVGYYSLAAGSVEPEKAPRRVRAGMGRYAIPVILLARLAVDDAEQKKGLGRALLKDALLRIAAAADEIGVRGVLVHAMDDEAKAFYERFDFEESPTDPLHLLLLMKDLRRLLRTAGFAHGEPRAGT